jgi:hypothetical protein
MPNAWSIKISPKPAQHQHSIVVIDSQSTVTS